MTFFCDKDLYGIEKLFLLSENSLPSSFPYSLEN